MTYYPASNEKVYVTGVVASYVDGYAPPKDGPFPIAVGSRGYQSVIHAWPEDLMPPEIVAYPTSARVEFEPDWTVRPGEHIREMMTEKPISDRDLARQMRRPTPYLLAVLDDGAPLTVELALDLEKHLGGKAQFWMNLETRHRIYLARKEREAVAAE